MRENKGRSKYCYEYPRASVTVDCVVFGLDMVEQELKVLLIKRGIEPFKGQFAFPGGFVQVEPPEFERAGSRGVDKSLESAARRELPRRTAHPVGSRSDTPGGPAAALPVAVPA